MSRHSYDSSNDTLTPIGGYQSVDDTLSATSQNPVKNRAVKAALDKKFDNTAASENSISSNDYIPFYDTSEGTNKKIEVSKLNLGGGGSTITITTPSEELFGQTVTLSKGSTTLSSSFDSQGTAVFTGVMLTGTLTIECEGYTTTVNAEYFGNYEVELTAGFSWQTWVDTASQLDSSDYDSLDEVLEDEKALRELFLEHACVDYMASMSASNEDLETIINNDLCAKWINLSDYALDYLYANEVIADLMDEADKYFYGEWALMPQVPTMTSDTTPFGTAFASREADYAWKAFDKNTSNRWTSGTGSGANEYVGYEFISPMKIVSFSVAFTNVVTAVNYNIQGYVNDEWVDLESNITSLSVDESLVSNPQVVTKVRLLINSQTLASGSTYYGNVAILQFYAWAPKGNVPVMTSNTAPYGTASASSTAGTNYEAWRTFDGNASSYRWNSGTNDKTASYLIYKFVNPIKPKRIMYRWVCDGTNHTTNVGFKFQASNDGTTWTDISETYSGVSNTSDVESSATDYYLYIKLLQVGGSNGMSCDELQFYGRELKVSVPTMTSNTAPYGEASATNLYQSNAYVGFSGATGARFNSSASSWELQYKFVTPIIPQKAHYGLSVNSGTITGTVKIQGSNNGTDWTDLTEAKSVSGPQGSFTYYNEDIETENLYLYLKAIYTKNSGSGTPFMLLQFYGLDYSEKEFEEGATKKWLYDHGVELETLTPYTTGTASINKKANVLNLVAPASNTRACLNYNIDFTNYDLERCKIENLSGQLILGVGSDLTGAGVANIGVIDTITSKNLAIDVSSINTTYYADVYANYNTKAANVEISEWWLE